MRQHKHKCVLGILSLDNGENIIQAETINARTKLDSLNCLTRQIPRYPSPVLGQVEGPVG